MSFYDKLDQIVQGVSADLEKWRNEQRRSCAILTSMCSISESLDVLKRALNSGEKSRWGALAAFSDLPDRLLAKEIDSLNRLSAKLSESVRKFEEVCSSVKRARKKALRLSNQQKEVPISALCKSSPTSFSVVDKLSWLDSIERALGVEVVTKSCLLENVSYEQLAQLPSVLEKWKQQTSLESVSSAVQRLTYSVSSRSEPP